MASGSGNEAIRRAILALNGRRPQEAEQIAGEVLRKDSRHAQASYIFGCALLMQGRAGDAIAPLESAARARRDPEIDTRLAVALRQAGRNDEALSRLKRAIKSKPPAIAAFWEIGDLLCFMNRDDEAIETLRRGIELAPMTPALSVQLGYLLLKCRDCAGAKEAFSRALAIAPASPDALYGLGKAHQELGESSEAAEYFRRCLVSKQRDTGVWLDLGHCLLEIGQRDAGYACFRTAARSTPKGYGHALVSLVKSARGKFWLKPSDAARFLREPRS